MNRLISAFFVLTFLFIFSCKKNRSLPLLTTLQASETTIGEARCGGVIYSEGDDVITAIGVCWSLIENPTIDDNKSNEGEGPKNFSSTLKGLSQNKTYHVRAYASNKFGTAYGRDEIFVTAAAAPVPVIMGKVVNNVTTNGLTFIAQVLVKKSDAPIINAGVCWSKFETPTTADNVFTVAVSPEGFMPCPISGLESNTSYTMCAFATNSTGTTYGLPTVIKTMYGTMTDFDKNVYFTVKIGNQIWMAENFRATHYRDGSFIGLVLNGSSWVQSELKGAYCYYDDSGSNMQYGVLYNWAAITHTKNISPPGWHVPSENEYQQLLATLGDGTDANSKLRSMSQGMWEDASWLTNSNGFNALPSGNREYSGSFFNLKTSSNCWTSSSANNYFGSSLYLDRIDANLTTLPKNSGASLRLIKD